MGSELITVAAPPCELGENPLWIENLNCVLWTDICGGKIFQLSLRPRQLKTIYQGEPVAGFTQQQNGDLLLFRGRDIALLNSRGAVSVLRDFADDGATRFNDVIADPEGRVFVGTIGKTKKSGGLYRLDPDGTLVKLFDGTGCSNGMGFSPDLATFYWTCSTTRRIFQFEYDRASGELRHRNLFYEVNSGKEIPDGLAVDVEGCVWSARWGGGSVARHSPKGEVLSSINFPARNITSLCFGGEKWDQLFVTSARADAATDINAGALFETRLPVSGTPEFKSNIH